MTRSDAGSETPADVGTSAPITPVRTQGPQTPDGCHDSSGSRPGLTRRAVLTGTGGLVAGTAGGLAAAGSFGTAPGGGDGPAVPPLRFFTDAEADAVEAMAERVFPADSTSPGARDAGVMNYIDGRLAGGWGEGERLYRQGPFHEPTDAGHGYQLPLTPRELYRWALRTLDDHCRDNYRGLVLAELPAEKQDEVLAAVERGEIEFGLATGPSGFTSASFFSMFLTQVTEGLFADPMYGGNRDAVGWKWLGFPGDPTAYGEPYARYFGEPHLSYRVDPKGMR